MMKSVLFLPTNRLIEKCVKSYIQEVNYAKQNLQRNIPLVIVETNSEPFTEKNKKIINIEEYNNNLIAKIKNNERRNFKNFE